MIFSGIAPNGKTHIELIIEGYKTETRRQTHIYKIGRFYAIQPKRGVKAILDGKIYVYGKSYEKQGKIISVESAFNEGFYFQNEYEDLYKKMYSDLWVERVVYKFKYISSLRSHTQTPLL